MVSDDKTALPVRHPLDLRAVGLVIMLCMIWGIQQVALKVVAGDVAPVMQLAIRFSGATIVFGAWVMQNEGPRAFGDGTLRSGLLLGTLFSLEFILAGESLVHTSAAHSIVFLYTAPIFTALGLQFLPEEKLSRVQWVGITVAFLGIVVAFLGFGGRSAWRLLTGDALALLAGMSWGVSNVVLRRGRVGGARTAKTVLYQVGTAAVLLTAFAAATGQARVQLTELSVLVLAFQTLVIAISSYVVWFWLLRHYLTSRLMLLSLLTPMFGVIFGTAFLGDPISTRFGIGGVLVLAGILIVNLPRLSRR
jgi:drug/metabolite transporter (DMT)-like permease